MITSLCVPFFVLCEQSGSVRSLVDVCVLFFPYCIFHIYTHWVWKAAESNEYSFFILLARKKNLLFSRANERKTKTHRKKTTVKAVAIIRNTNDTNCKINLLNKIKKQHTNEIEIKLLIQHKNKDLLHQSLWCSILLHRRNKKNTPNFYQQPTLIAFSRFFSFLHQQQQPLPGLHSQWDDLI